MEKQTRLSIQWFYNLLAEGECELLDFKEQLNDKIAFGKSIKSFSNSYDEMARDVVAFSNKKGGFIFVGVIDGSKQINADFEYDNPKIFEPIHLINTYQLRKLLNELQDLEFIEATGKTSGLKYIIHKSKLETTEDKISYSKQKKQERARQIEAILRYLDDIEEIDNEATRKLLNLPESNASYISRLFTEMLEKKLIEIAQEKGHNQRTYKRKNE